MPDPKQQFLANPPSFMETNIVIIRNNMIASGGPYEFDIAEAPTHRLVATRGDDIRDLRTAYELTIREPSPAVAPGTGSAAAAAAAATSAPAPSVAGSRPDAKAYWLRYKAFAPYYDSCTLGGAANFFFTAELTGCRLDFGDVDTPTPRVIHISGELVANSKAAKRDRVELDGSKDKAVASFKTQVARYAGKYSMKTYGHNGIVTVWGMRDVRTGRWRFFAHKRVGPPEASRQPGARSSSVSRWLQAGSEPIRFP